MTERTALGDIFSIGLDVTSCKIDPTTGAMLAQLGDATGAEADSDAAEIWQQAGIASLPAPPSSGTSSCQALAIRRTDRDIIFATCDKRATSTYGKLNPGETCVFATVGQARTLYKADGHVVDMTTSDNTPTGKTHTSSLGPDGFKVVTVFGGLSIDENGITLTLANGQGALTISPAGEVKLMGVLVSVLGQVVGIAGKTATCLGSAAAPTLAPGPTSVLIGPVGSSGVASRSVFCSP